MSLQSHGSQLTGEHEEDCAERWRAWYGLERAHYMARVFAKTAPSRPLEGYYRKVADYLGRFVESRGSQTHIPKDKRSLRQFKKRKPQPPTVDEILEAFHAKPVRAKA